MLSLTDREKAELRVKCLSLVLDNGSRIDANNPKDKAEEYYSFIINDNCPKKESAKKVESAGKQVQKTYPPKGYLNKIEYDLPVETTELKEEEIPVPFPDSGRKKVILS
jgi:hypothetical protein